MGPSGIHCQCCVDIVPTEGSNSLKRIKQYLNRLFRRKTKQSIQSGIEG